MDNLIMEFLMGKQYYFNDKFYYYFIGIFKNGKKKVLEK